MNTTQPVTTIARSSRLTNTLCIGLYVMTAVGDDADRVGLRVRAEPEEHHLRQRDEQAEHRHELGGLARRAQEAEQQPVEDRARRSGATMPTENSSASVHRPVMRDVRVVVDGGHEERDRPERQVEDARRAVREHQTDRQQRVDAAEAQSEQDRAEELTHARLLRSVRRVTGRSLGHPCAIGCEAHVDRRLGERRRVRAAGDADPRLARRRRDRHELAVACTRTVEEQSYLPAYFAIVRAVRARAGRCAGSSSRSARSCPFGVEVGVLVERVDQLLLGEVRARRA